MTTPEPTAEQIAEVARIIDTICVASPIPPREGMDAAIKMTEVVGRHLLVLISRAERAEREAKEMAAALQRIINRVNRGGYKGQQIVAEATTALTRNSAGGGLEHERGAGNTK